MKNLVGSHPWVALGVTAALAFFLGVGAGASSPNPSTTSDAVEDPVVAAELATAESERDALQDEVTQLEADLNELTEAAAQLEEERAALRKQSRELAAREKKVSGMERAVARNTISDGIWQVGTDFDAGLYRAPGGSGCYWALLGSADTQDIINNGGFGPNQTIQIASPWFESSNCGEWKKVG